MCTAISLKTNKNEIFFGRTMDFSYELNPEIYIVPRNYKWNTGFNNTVVNKYKYIGTGQNIKKVIFADGINENGLGAAALYFQGYASYDQYNNHNNSIASIDMVNYLLGNFKNIKEVIDSITDINIIGVEDEITNSVAPLHWIVIDKNNDCITIEKTESGLQVFKNPLKVLANSPNFEWHMTNLRNYLNILPSQPEKVKWDNVLLTPFGQGAGTFGLPGDYTSPSRFVRVSFQKSFVSIPSIKDEVVNLCFSIMKSVTIPKGIVITNLNNYDYTQYTVFMDITNGDYYFNTYKNNEILKANINDIDSFDIISLGKLKRPTHFNHI